MAMVTPFSRYANIPLEILKETDGRQVDWHRDLIINAAKVPASNRTLYQADGWGDWEYSPRVLVPSLQSWQELSRARGLRADLWIPAEATAESPPYTIEHRHGQDYAIFTGVMLMSVSSVRRLNDGRVVARVTFRRRSEEEYVW